MLHHVIISAGIESGPHYFVLKTVIQSSLAVYPCAGVRVGWR